MVVGSMRNWINWIIGIIGFVVVLVVLGVAFIYSGIYNVSANYPEGALMAWVMSSTMDHSVHRHAAGIKVPALDDPAMVQLGLSHYRGMCAECHGAPGVEVGAAGRGLSPSPPKLTEVAGDWSPSELFWITKHGVRMTGMPAWAPTHSDKEIWAIIAFIRKLPTMSKEEYQKMADQAPQVD